MNIVLDGFIYDTFIYEESQYVVLNNQMFNDKSKLFIARVCRQVEHSFLEALDKDEYIEVVQFYKNLKYSFLDRG